MVGREIGRLGRWYCDTITCVVDASGCAITVPCNGCVNAFPPPACTDMLHIIDGCRKWGFKRFLSNLHLRATSHFFLTHTLFKARWSLFNPLPRAISHSPHMQLSLKSDCYCLLLIPLLIPPSRTLSLQPDGPRLTLSFARFLIFPSRTLSVKARLFSFNPLLRDFSFLRHAHSLSTQTVQEQASRWAEKVGLSGTESLKYLIWGGNSNDTE